MHRLLFALTLSSSLLLSPAGRSALLGGLQALLTPATSGPALKEGCGFDPNGRCAPAPVDAGCIFDPNGRCAPTPVPIDEGCGWDPNGCPSGS